MDRAADTVGARARSEVVNPADTAVDTKERNAGPATQAESERRVREMGAAGIGRDPDPGCDLDVDRSERMRGAGVGESGERGR